MKQVKNSFRNLISLLLFTIMLWLGFKREEQLIYVENWQPQFKYRFEKLSDTNYQKELKNTVNFQLSIKLQSVILFSLFYWILTASILYLLSGSIGIVKIISATYLLYMISSLILISTINFGVDYRFSVGLAHYIEDLFVSPYILIICIVAMKGLGLLNKSKD